MHRKHRIALMILLLAVMITCFMAGRQFQLLADSTGAGPGVSRALTAYRIASVARPAAGPDHDEVTLRPLETFSQVLDSITRSYVEPVNDRSKLTYGAVRGMLAALRDPYTRFMEPQEYRSFQEENQGRFEGIGATLGLSEVKADKQAAKVMPGIGIRCPECGSEIRPRVFRIAIISPIPGSPAAKAGIQAGDLILQINGVSTEGMGVNEAANKIRGERGTKVKLLIGRKGLDHPVLKEITRGPIEVHTVETKELPDHIGYMRINFFYDDTARAVSDGLEKLRKQHIRGLVVDVRNNPGGLLNRCVEVARQFVAEEPVVYVQERGEPMQPYTGPSSGKGHKFDLPLVMLVNKGSASASEILAGAIKDAKVGTLIGTTTYGKGSVQTILPLDDGSAIALTTAKWFTLSRHDINHNGVAPDVVVELNPDVALDSAEDTQYQKALEMLRQRIAARN